MRLIDKWRHKITGSYDLACGKDTRPEGIKVAWFWKDVTCPRCLKARVYRV
jgi:hypothetical protein